MPDLARELLVGALRFASAQLRAIDALASADRLAAAFGIDTALAHEPAVAQHLEGARARLGEADEALALADPDPAQAARSFSLALSESEAALAAVHWPNGNPGLAGLLRLLLDKNVPAKGLLGQLGLPALPSSPAGISVEDGTIVYQLDRAAPIAIPPGAPLLRAASCRLVARLRLTNPRVPLFAMTLSANRVAVTLVDDVVTAVVGGTGVVEADLVVSVDTDRGLTVGGTSSTRVSLPASSASGALDVRDLVLEAPPEIRDSIDVGATVHASLGPVELVLAGSGLRLRFDAGAIGDGAAPLSVAPLRPSGIGVSLDTPLVRGGGFLAERSDGFGGALDVSLGPIEVQAVGLLNVGGDAGFALVMVMSVDFVPPVDLSFGFTLNTVGGIVGVQHVLDLTALKDAVVSHTIDGLLFPRDMVAAAPAILRTLGTVFPVRTGGLVVGPMVRIGWGRPVSFATATLGLVLSLPDPTVAIVGQVRVNVPAPELPIVDLKADVDVTFTSDAVVGTLVLADSRIGGYPVSGDFGLLMRFGSSPELAFSAGGFHPRFHPPPELANLRRVAIDLSPPVLLQLRAEAYLALTTGTFQLGTRIEMSADLGPVGAHGHLEFDAIAHLAPFRFEADLDVGVSVEFEGESIAGVRLRLSLEGPAPFRAHGSGSFDLLFLTIPVDIPPIEWGDERNSQPSPSVNPREIVADALQKPAAWQTRLPDDSERLVRLRLDVAAPPLLVHPLGKFEVRETALPLETVITHFGANRVPKDEAYVHLGSPHIGAVDTGAISEVTDLFAMAQFLDLTDDEKLSLPSFEQMPAGLRIDAPAGAAFDLGNAEEIELKYETFVADVGDPLATLRREAFELTVEVLQIAPQMVLAAGAAGRSALRDRRRFAMPAESVAVADAAAVVVLGTNDLAPRPDIASGALTYTHAAQALADAVAANPSRRGELQLVRLGVAP